MQTRFFAGCTVLIVAISVSLLPNAIAQRSATDRSFEGRGVVQGSIFRRGQDANVALKLKGNTFDLEFTSLVGGGVRVAYRGTFVQPRTASTPNRFVINGNVRSFLAPASAQPTSTTGKCRIEVFNARVVASNCSTSVSGSPTQFLGLEQF